MQITDHANQDARDLYWLAYLLTGDREASVAATIEVLDLQNDTLAWSRRAVIAKALTAIREELAVSAHRTGSRRNPKFALPPRGWALDPGTTKVEMERALLAIDAFPRCAVVLSVFEGVSPDAVAILLDADLALVRKARITGLRELTRNLARAQVSSLMATGSYLMTNGMQHA
jgi:DNA-directed RNA polymerase specialized sigma24 family protein